MRRVAAGVIACICSLLLVSCGVSRNSTRENTARTEMSAPTSDVAKFPNRRNRGNDGTSYEPCVSLTKEAADELGIDPMSVRDAALVDGQTARGCDWSYRDSRWWLASQIVGNSPSLTAYKQAQQTYRWRDDVIIGDRTTAVSEVDQTTCATHIQSGTAGITTLVQYAFTNGPTIDEICERAIAFTKATIDKMPP